MDAARGAAWNEAPKITALAGGVGAARFLEGLAAIIAPERLAIIGNTGDDLELHGLHISPDLDTVAYTLAGLASEVHGWGLRDDTFACLRALGRFSSDEWFHLGDRDLAAHLFRTGLLRSGAALSEVTAEITRALGVGARLLPMTNDRFRTMVQTEEAGLLDFQEYFVKRRAEDEVTGIIFDGAEQARPAPGVIEAIREADGVIVCPSNPLISIGPILAVAGIRETLRETRARVAAVSPIVGGRALKGPADRMMRGMGLDPSARGIAELYSDFVDVLVIDHADRAHQDWIEAAGMKVVITNTIMKDSAAKRVLARVTLEALR